MITTDTTTLVGTPKLDEGLEMLLALDKINLPEWRYGYTLALMGFSTDEAVQIIIKLNEMRRKTYHESKTTH